MVALSLILAAVARPATAALRVGDVAPDFTVTSHTGTPVSLSEYRGRKVILWFYPRASTGG